MKRGLAGPLLALTLLALGVFLASLALGEVRIPLPETVRVLLGRSSDPMAVAVVREIRLPRTLVCAAVGAALSASGVLMQAFFRNPLASPDLLGVSAGGSLGAVTALALGWASRSLWALPAAALGGAWLALGGVLLLARRGMGTERLLLAGVALNALLGAGTSFVLTLTILPFELNAQMLFWILGGVESRTWEHVWLAVPAIALGGLLALPLGRSLNLLSLGENSAQTLGVDVRRLRWTLLALVTTLTSLAVAVAGVIGFVGLVVPHLLRLAFGPDHRRLLPLSLAGGAAFLMLADLAARMLPGGLRLGVVTALAGAPTLLWLLRRLA